MKSPCLDQLKLILYLALYGKSYSKVFLLSGNKLFFHCLVPCLTECVPSWLIVPAFITTLLVQFLIDPYSSHHLPFTSLFLQRPLRKGSVWQYVAAILELASALNFPICSLLAHPAQIHVNFVNVKNSMQEKFCTLFCNAFFWLQILK